MRLALRRVLPVVLSLVLLITLISCGNGNTGSARKDVTAVSGGGETRDTLSPAYFTGTAAKAYWVAKEIPEVLDSLHCYCECKKNFGHKSLLTCYVDNHAQRCGICQDEAFMAYDLYTKGHDIGFIRKAVDDRFSR
ncbi:MAG: hypothetical protein BMS9Abin23_0303 [Thermodesulfobacteriota bacterium]|nr:MAG: hypothetical protein BMS9Abin23_0303 [Thermodesulfobacteriota bacterium]